MSQENNLAKCSKCGDTEHNNGRCTTCGRMCKGFSPNKGKKRADKKPAGALSAEDKKTLKELIVSKNMSKLAAWFAERATTADLAFKYVKELAPYLAPKLSSIQSEVKQDTTIKIEIAGFENISLQHNPQEKIIDGTATHIDNKDN